MPKIPLINIPKGYRSQARDTSVEVDFLQFQLWQKKSLIEKAKLIVGVTQACRQLTLMGIKNQYPDKNLAEQRYLYAQRILGEETSKLLKNIDIKIEIMIGNPIKLALSMAKIFDNLEIPYFVGGSVASSLWGESRATLDIDLVADLTITKMNDFIVSVEDVFYVSENAVKEAIINQSSFNLIHFETNEKIDIFVLGNKPLLQQEMQRKKLEKVTEENDFLYLATPEDIILQKLIWYRDGNLISDRQWRDVLGVLKTQSSNLDLDYLKYWSKLENISHLLNQALLESGLQ
jgi:hypothetical protein